MTIRENEEEKGKLCYAMLYSGIYWDNSSTPMVEAPLGDFLQRFANVIASLPIVVNPTGKGNSYLKCRFVKERRILLQNEHPKDITSFFYTVNYAWRIHSSLKTLCISTHTEIGKDM